MIDDIDPKLQRFFVPQLLQCGLEMQPARYGVMSVMPEEYGTGYVWAGAVGRDCLITMHDIRCISGVVLHEYPDDYYCLSLMSSTTVEKIPHVQLQSDRASNVVSFWQEAGEYTCALDPHERYWSRNITLLSSFFTHWEGGTLRDMEALRARLSQARVHACSPRVARTLERLSLERAKAPGAELWFSAIVREALFDVLNEETEAVRALERAGDDEAVRLCRETERLVQSHLSEDLSLDSIAKALYVGRTRLCAIFKQERGVSLGRYITNQRMDRACAWLLEQPLLPIAEVGRRVGYKRSSSFVEAFGRVMGCSPQVWRLQALGEAPVCSKDDGLLGDNLPEPPI